MIREVSINGGMGSREGVGMRGPIDSISSGQYSLPPSYSPLLESADCFNKATRQTLITNTHYRY